MYSNSIDRDQHFSTRPNDFEIDLALMTLLVLHCIVPVVAVHLISLCRVTWIKYVNRVIIDSVYNTGAGDIGDGK